MIENIKVNEMGTFFEKLLKSPYRNKNNLLEAINNFRYESYKSSVMLLFSIMDGEIIKFQSENNNRKRGNKIKSG